MYPLLAGSPVRRAHATVSGFAFIEVMFATIVLAVALLSYVASSYHQHRFAEEERTRSQVLAVARQFMEELHSDEDWSGLYGRCLTMQQAAENPTGGMNTLADGTGCYDLTSYYSTVEVPESIAMRVLVEVPCVTVTTTSAGDGSVLPGDGSVLPGDGSVLPGDGSGTETTTTSYELLETATLPEFGLPADLDGDGLLTDADLSDAYNVLPVRVTVWWQPRGEDSREMVLATWLRGSR